MKAVNLLPPTERPRSVAQASPNASVAVLAVLAALMIGVAGWVLTKNQVNDRHGAIATANQEKAEADQQSQGLQAFGDFSKIKETRTQSITDLASKRFDWERFMRELALVLPDKVWVSDLSAGGSADTAAAGASTSAPAASSGTATAATADAASPSVAIKGCAPSQKAVAEAIVRLRSLHGAQDVDLKNSQRAEDDGAVAGGSSDSAGGETDGCGRYYEFDASVTFKAEKQAAKDGGKSVKTPSRLGGGA